jgi:hypothetical protein
MLKQILILSYRSNDDIKYKKTEISFLLFPFNKVYSFNLNSKFEIIIF